MIDIAFTTLVADSSAPLERAIARWTGSRDAAPDLVQETFLRAYRHRGSVREAGSARGWVFAIARQVAVDWRRREGRRGALPLGDVEPAAPAPEGSGLTTEARRAIVDAVASLEPDLRAVVELKYDAALSYDEIGAVEGVPASTVQARLRAARRRLAERLPELAPAAGSVAAAGADGAASSATHPDAAKRDEADEGPATDPAASAISDALRARPATGGLAGRTIAACERTPAVGGLSPLRIGGGIAGAAAAVAVAVALLLPRDGGVSAASASAGAGVATGAAVAMAAAPAPRALPATGEHERTSPPAPASGPSVAARDLGAPAGASAPSSLEVVTAGRERLLGERALTLNFPDVALPDVVIFFGDITGLDFAVRARPEASGAAAPGAPAGGRPGDEARVHLRVKDISLSLALDLVSLLVPYDAVAEEEGPIAFVPRAPGAPATLRRKGPLERAQISVRAREAERKVRAAADLRLAPGAAALRERLDALAGAAGVSVVLLPEAPEDRDTPGPIAGASLAGALDATLRAAGPGLEWRIFEEVVLVGPEGSFPPGARAWDAPPPADESGAPLVLPPLRDPTPRDLAAAIAHDGRPVVLDAEAAALTGSALTLACEGEATAALLERALALTGAPASISVADGAVIVLASEGRARNRRGRVSRLFRAPEGVSASWTAWYRTRMEAHASIEGRIVGLLRDVESGRSLASRVAAAEALGEERARLEREMLGGLCRAMELLIEVRAARDASDPVPEIERMKLVMQHIGATWKAPASDDESDERTRLDRENTRLGEEVNRLEAQVRLRAVALRWCDALERYDAGATPEEVFRGEHERFSKEATEAR